MAEKKAVLNVTVDESLAEDVRRAAKLEHTTISSVVERALREKLSWELKRLEGIRAIEAYYEEHGHPTPEVVAAARARVDEEHRLIDEARLAMAARDRGAETEGDGVA
jgi:predicted transcriptional regulator